MSFTVWLSKKPCLQHLFLRFFEKKPYFHLPCLFNISTVALAAKVVEVKETIENENTTEITIFFIVFIILNVTFCTYGLMNYCYSYNW